MQYLPGDHPIYGLQARGYTTTGCLPRTIEEMASGYLDEIHKVQPAGPYHLIGWSFGGVPSAIVR
jgi:aspartate racemase